MDKVYCDLEESMEVLGGVLEKSIFFDFFMYINYDYLCRSIRNREIELYFVILFSDEF